MQLTDFSLLLSVRNHFYSGQTTKELVRGNAQKSTELVPVWKVYGFLQNDGDVTKNTTELHQQMKQKQMFCIHSNQVSPYKWPSSASSSSTATTTTTAASSSSAPQSDKCNNQTIKTTLQRLMHRTRSAMLWNKRVHDDSDHYLIPVILFWLIVYVWIQIIMYRKRKRNRKEKRYNNVY